MKLNNHYSDEDLEEKSEELEENFEKLEESNEKQDRFNFGKIIGILGMLKLQGLKVSEKILDYFFIVLEFTIRITKKVFGFLRSKIAFRSRVKSLWTKEADVYKMYLVYRKVVSEQANDYFNRFKRAKDDEEQKKWKEKANNFSTQNTSLPNLPFGYKVEFAFKSSFHNAKYTIINVTLCIMIFFSIMLDMNGLTAPIFLNLKFLALTYSVFLSIVYFNNIKKVIDLVENNNQYYNDIWKFTIEGYNKIIEEINSRINKGKLKGKDEADNQLQPIKQQSTVSQSSTVQQQPKQEEVYNNPYSDMWKEINRKYFKLDNFRIPEYERLELIERHTIHDYDLKEEDVVKISENIEKYRGVPINSIKSIDGKIIVDFLIGEFPNLIPFSEVPKVDENFIVAGKSAEGWITWNLDRQPHGLIVGTTGSGKSNTVRFVFNEFQKKKNYLMYVIDFKGGSDYYFLDGKYKLITDTEGFIDFIKKLDSELTYRQKLFKDLRSNEIDEINNILKKKGENTIPHLKVFMDEFAFVSSLPKEIKNSVIKAIEQLMQRGRSFGMHFTFIVQKPTAENLGSSYIRSLIGFRLIGKLEEEADYEKSFGASNNLKGQDKVFADKMKNEADFLGKFVVKGGYIENNPLGRNIIVRIPFMDVSDYDKMVLNEWEDNPYADYKLHYESDEKDEVLNKLYGKEAVSTVDDYEQIKAEEVEVDGADDNFDIYDTLM